MGGLGQVCGGGVVLVVEGGEGGGVGDLEAGGQFEGRGEGRGRGVCGVLLAEGQVRHQGGRVVRECAGVAGDTISGEPVSLRKR